MEKIVAKYRKVLLATNNPGKLAELRQLLKGLAAELVSLDEAGIRLHVEESGTSYEENARSKSLAAAEISDLPAIGDDSGLEIAGLDWKPGLLSARYYTGTWPRRLQQLLVDLKDKVAEERKARFVCVLVFVQGNQVIAVGHGALQCSIAQAPAGEQGFGYDPIVVPEGYNLALGQIPTELKNQISHRALAARDLLSKLDHWR